MPRKHLFPLVVLLGAVVVAGLLAVTSSVDLGQSANASTTSDPAISFRLQELDRFERSLRQQLAATDAPATAAPRTVYERAPSTTGETLPSTDAEHEEDDDAYEDDDAFEQTSGHDADDEDDGRDD